MFVAYHPEEFASGRYAGDGSYWGITWNETETDIFATNPKFDIPDYASEMLTLWQASVEVSDNGNVHIAILPEAGGMLDQSAAMMDAYSWMCYCHREIVAGMRDRK